MMWRHGDMATSIRQALCDERGGTGKCRHVAMSPRQCFVVVQFRSCFGYGAVIANIRKLNFSSGFGSQMKIPMTSLSWGV